MGTAVMSVLLLLPRWLGLGKIDVIPAVGALITGKQRTRFPSAISFISPRHRLCLLLLGSLAADENTPCLVGFWNGRVHPRHRGDAARVHHGHGAPPIARYHERGPMTGLAQLIAHIVYGIVVGLIVHALQ